MKRRKSVIAIAVASGVLSWVYLVDGEVKDWKTWRRCVSDPAVTRSRIRQLIAEYQPDTVVTEDPDRDCAKAGATLKLLRVIAQDAADQSPHHVRVVRSQAGTNKYEEAKALAIRFPELAPLLPAAPRLFVREQRRMIVFEALAMTLVV